MNLGVSVKHTYLIDDKYDEESISGIFLGQGFILTHGLIIEKMIKDPSSKIFKEALLRDGFLYDREKLDVDEWSDKFKSVFTVYIPRSHCKTPAMYIQDIENESNPGKLHIKEIYSHNPSKFPNYRYHIANAKLMSIFLVENINDAVLKLFSIGNGWTIPDASDNNNYNSISNKDLKFTLLSTFVLLSIVNFKKVLVENGHMISDTFKLVDFQSTPVKGTLNILSLLFDF